MITLKLPTHKIRIALGESANTELGCYAGFKEWGSGISNNNNLALILTTGATPIDFVTPPSAENVQRDIHTIIIPNRDNIAHKVILYYNVDGTDYLLRKATVPSGSSLDYEDNLGFTVQEQGLNSIKSFTVHGDASANFVMTNATQAERFAGNTTRHLFMVDLEGYTQVRLRLNQQVTSASVNTPLFRAKYYTSFNTTVGNFLQLGLSEQVQLSMTGTGYRDTGWIDLATSARQSGICIGFTELGGDGVADPALGATDILFR